MGRHCFLIYIVSLCTSCLAGEIFFIKENIDVSILDRTTVKVYGEYFFTASDSQNSSASLYYPFPIDSISLYPSFIQVLEKNSGASIGFDQNPQGVFFSFSIAGNDTSCIAITYKQKVKQHTGRYILLTTSSWGKPLENSRYCVHVPAAYTLSYLSYECDSVTLGRDMLTYHFFRTKFLPDRDLIFSWTVPEAKNSSAITRPRKR
ncbi:MAG: hypothetical protein JW768_06225 [Chitinispirillaceae bacterium]|nr:hypothetical protein [Chitinispirillaceae bacterium]